MKRDDGDGDAETHGLTECMAEAQSKSSAAQDVGASLSARLQSLLSSFDISLPQFDLPSASRSEPPSRRSAELPGASAMRPPRSIPSTPHSAQRQISSSSTRYGHSPKSHSVSMPLEHASTQLRSRQDKPALPVLRWFSANRPQSSRPHPVSPAHSHAASPSVRYDDSHHLSPTTPSSAASALADALHDDPHLIEAHSRSASGTYELSSRPEAARLPASFLPSRPPAYFSNLTRSTLPTACISPPPALLSSGTGYTDPWDESLAAQPDHNPEFDMFLSPTPTPVAMPHSPAPVHLSSSPPSFFIHSSRSSIDSLRSIQDRGRALHTTPPAQALKLPQLPTSILNWFSADDKENLSPMLSEEDRAETAEEEREHIRKKYTAPKNPVVFCHGLLGFDTVTLGPSIAPLQVSHWRGIRDVLEANGIEVLITRVPATSSPIDRAKVLADKISEVYPGRSVHLIGHSMGGLDCRYLTTHLTPRPFKVLSVTTISTPHRGSAFADHFIATVGRARMPNVLQLLDLLPNGGGDGAAFEFLTVENMRRFNEDTPDVKGVKYFSWGAVYEPGLIDTWKWSHSVILEKEGPNDGLVSLKSAKWGTYLGTLEGVNHLDLVGWINSARYKWAEIMGREIKFKPATFYLGIADLLARVVEGQDGPQEQEQNGEGEDSAEREEREEMRERSEMADILQKGADTPERDGNGDGGGEPFGEQRGAS
ncbi:Lipase 2 [Grifola frondosa]|uniref:GPI inositol-deacylase n=1 Tax=Grifola frondosa TaxID=5627 RepID=A0A1C7MUG2_GRIFR|nr:Lipase 2 [Grifola frondosa]